MTADTYDPMSAAMDAEAQTQTKNYFGRCVIDAWPCVLVKGQKPQLYDPTQHASEQRRTRIVISLEPLPQSRFQQNITRELIAESKEWTETVRPSLKALGVDLRAVSGQWVQVEMKPTRSYTASDGTQKQATQPAFVAIYPSMDACQEASDKLFHRTGDDAAPATAAPTAPSGDLQRAEAAKLLPALWAMAHKDIGKFAQDIAKMPQTASYFDMTSPEVLALVAN